MAIRADVGPSEGQKPTICLKKVICISQHLRRNAQTFQQLQQEAHVLRLGKWGIKGACVHLEEMADAVAVGWTAPVPIPFARVCEVGWWAGSACRGEPAASAVACLGANAWP